MPVDLWNAIEVLKFIAINVVNDVRIFYSGGALLPALILKSCHLCEKLLLCTNYSIWSYAPATLVFCEKYQQFFLKQIIAK